MHYCVCSRILLPHILPHYYSMHAYLPIHYTVHVSNTPTDGRVRVWLSIFNARTLKCLPPRKWSERIPSNALMRSTMFIRPFSTTANVSGLTLGCRQMYNILAIFPHTRWINRPTAQSNLCWGKHKHKRKETQRGRRPKTMWCVDAVSIWWFALMCWSSVCPAKAKREIIAFPGNPPL